MSGGEGYDRRAQERFWNKVDKSGGPDACWPWTATTNGRGYGNFGYRGRMVRAHRFAMGIVGETPGLEACHSCRNRLCCNPAHLRLGTSKENAADRDLHGTTARPVGSRNGSSRLAETEVRSLLQDHRTGRMSQRMLARKYGISQASVWRILNGKNWKHINQQRRDR